MASSFFPFFILFFIFLSVILWAEGRWEGRHAAALPRREEQRAKLLGEPWQRGFGSYGEENSSSR